MNHVVDIVKAIGGFWCFLMVGAAAWAITEVVQSILKHRRQVGQSEQLAVLKKSMIDRGMSADEIDRVIRSGGAADDKSSAKTAKAPKGGPITSMIEHGMEAEDIEKVIRSGVTTQETPDQLVRVMSEYGYNGDAIARVVAALDRRPTVPVI